MYVYTVSSLLGVGSEVKAAFNLHCMIPPVTSFFFKINPFFLRVLLPSIHHSVMEVPGTQAGFSLSVCT